MKKTSTQLTYLPVTTTTMPSDTYIQNSETPTDHECGPKKSTLDFLRQLARCYSAKPALAIPELRGAILN